MLLFKTIMFFFWVFVIMFLALPYWLPKFMSKYFKKKEFYLKMESHFSASKLSFIHKMKNSAALLQKYYFYFTNVKIFWNRKTGR